MTKLQPVLFALASESIKVGASTFLLSKVDELSGFSAVELVESDGGCLISVSGSCSP
jgi:hypothetical protein